MIRRWFLLPLVSGVILVLDQWTKSLVVANLHLGEAWAPFPQFAGFFDIAHWMNTGAAFGLFPQLGGVFTIVAFVVSIGIVWYYHGLEANDWLVRVSLGMQLGGALGNLLDRVRYGYVVDFIHFHFFPVFNIADSAIVCGVAILMWDIFQKERKASSQQATNQQPN